MKNHKDVRVGDGVKQTHVDYNTKLIIRMATREDSGTYILTAENMNGKDTAYAEVTVLGKINILIFTYYLRESSLYDLLICR